MFNFLQRDVNYYCEPDGVESSAGTAENSQENGNNNNGTIPEQENNSNPKWTAQLSTSIKGEDLTEVAKFKNITELANAYLTLKGKRNDSGQAGEEDLYKDFDGKLTVGDPSGEVSKSFISRCKELKIDPKSAKELMASLDIGSKKQEDDFRVKAEQQVKQIEDFMKIRWGNEYDTNLSKVNSFVKTITKDDEEFYGALIKTSLMKNPFVLELLNKVVKTNIVKPETNSTSGEQVDTSNPFGLNFNIKK